ncbi:ubiquitin-protein ligase E3C-like [Mizuhopecten yessoensis]|uniref:Ubiquitin-protein ligase E3C n=1 Tax=Mizuhopecten yessoensis TaxID=6573 RepID=A0A210R166_MIZYE|nr:ubiquitin-protein ligase E3C-like [Mizuhopecten yessoensis]OWF54780.1 Ubiquitin-protein ligase E3C [Mizuhopecten yessoensis]
MYSFEGDFRRKPIQSLRGASKKEEKDQLLIRAQVERQRREEVRLQHESATKIQAYFRSYAVRKQQMVAVRGQFDQIVQSAQRPESLDMKTLCFLQQKLCFFYSNKLDPQRLIWMCQNVIKRKNDYLTYMCTRIPGGLYHIQRLLLLCLRHLKDVIHTAAPIAIPMRMLEMFTSLELYRSHKFTEHKEGPVHHLWLYLINHGYFDYMRVILEAKVPSDLERTAVAPTPLADSILGLIMGPVSFAIQHKGQPFSHCVLKAICQSLLCPAYSEQIEHFLLPAMAYGRFPFPFVDLIQALISDTARNSKHGSQVSGRSKRSSSTSIEMTPWLLGALVTLADKYIEVLNTKQTVDFLSVLKKLLPSLPTREVQDDDSDDEMDVDQLFPTDGLQKIQQDCMTFLNSPNFVQRVIECHGNKMSHDIVSAICVVCHALMTHHHLEIHKVRLLYSLAFSKAFIRGLWSVCTTTCNWTVMGTEASLIQMLACGVDLSDDDVQRIVPLLAIFCSMFNHFLYTIHDADFYGDTKPSSMPFRLEELVPMTLVLRDTCLGVIELAHPDTRLSISEDYHEALIQAGMKDKPRQKEDEDRHNHMWAYLFKVTSSLVRQLYSRDTRRMFCPYNFWLSDRVSIQADKPSQIYRAQGSVFTRRPFGTMKSLTKTALDEDGPPLSNTDVKNLVILTELPFVVTFEERFKILQKLIQTDRQEYQGEMTHFLSGPSISVMIRRNYIYEDAFDKLSPENEPNLKLKMRVQLVNAAGLDEAGIDGGGIFREFLSELLKTGFDPNRGLFCYTTDQLLYPNPKSTVLMENYTKHYFFLGRMLGKAIYENMLVELPFASFFLSKILSRHGGNLDIHHLASLDPELYRNLLSLKTYEDDVVDLGLDFTTVNDDFGQTKVIELKPGGRQIAVDNHNRIEYIHLMADHKLNKQIRVQCTAFRQGMSDVLNLDWLRMFDHHELQVLISGAITPVNIEDLQHHTNYSGGYTDSHPIIQMFWKVVQQFTNRQKRQLLKFVTSCSRPPLLGFKDLYPAFCVHYGGNELDRLPTASTCMNLLRLPEFSDEKTMKTKLLYAVESESGFELS